MASDFVVHRNYGSAASNDDNEYKEGERNSEQIIFDGFLPVDKHRYTICVVMDKKGEIAFGKHISYTVSKLAAYLNKR